MTPEELISKIEDLVLNPLIVLMIGIALVVFIWGVIEFIAGADNVEARSKGRRHIMWGIIGLFIMFGVAGIIEIILNFWKDVKS